MVEVSIDIAPTEIIIDLMNIVAIDQMGQVRTPIVEIGIILAEASLYQSNYLEMDLGLVVRVKHGFIIADIMIENIAIGEVIDATLMAMI